MGCPRRRLGARRPLSFSGRHAWRAQRPARKAGMLGDAAAGLLAVWSRPQQACLASHHPRAASGAHAGSVGELRRSRGYGYYASGGNSGSRRAGAPSVGCGPWVVAVGHSACRRPGQAEQTTVRTPASESVSRLA